MIKVVLHNHDRDDFVHFGDPGLRPGGLRAPHRCHPISETALAKAPATKFVLAATTGIADGGEAAVSGRQTGTQFHRGQGQSSPNEGQKPRNLRRFDPFTYDR